MIHNYIYRIENLIKFKFAKIIYSLGFEPKLVNRKKSGSNPTRDNESITGIAVSISLIME